MNDSSRAGALELTLEARVEAQFLDQMGHMNVAWYMQLFNSGVWTFFERNGLSEAYLRQSQRGMFGLEDSLRYLSELRDGARLEVRTGLLELRSKTVRLLQHMVDVEQQKIAATREVVAVHIDLKTRRSTPFEAAVAAQLETATRAGAALDGMTEAEAQRFARRWVEAWNRLDVEAVLEHFADDAVFVSPKAERLTGQGRVEGKAALRAYWTRAVEHVKRLTFTLDLASWSSRAQTLTVLYTSAVGDQPPVRAGEVMSFRDGLIVRGEALYGGAA
jgi:acyl-CoA thioesterase FadM/ketosteroid isomerase-like protein